MKTAALVLVVSVMRVSLLQATQNPESTDYGTLPPDVIISRGFEYEIHYINSSDGFLPAMHRIVNPNFPIPRSSVLMFHGLGGSSNNFLDSDNSGYIDDPKTVIGSNLGLELARKGHDVWLLDQRGTPFSSNHSYFKPDQKEYWDWSLDEIALLDLPAAIDYIRAYTHRDHVAYIAHSQGTLVMFMLLSRVRKYNDIVRPFIALAPVFYMSEVVINRGVLIRHAPFDQVEKLLKRMGGKWTDDLVTRMLKKTCKSKFAKIALCQPFGLLFFSYGSPATTLTLPSMNYNRISTYLSSSFFFSVSSLQAAHFLQITRTNKPQMLDYWPSKNFKTYGHSSAPIYDPTRIMCKNMAFISAVNDVLAHPKDVQHLREMLKVPLVYDQIIRDSSFGHISFVFGDKQLIVPRVVKPVLKIMSAMYPEIEPLIIK